MKIETWVDNLTDESNLWLNAIREEETGNFADACKFYLRDASQCLKAGLPVRAALSSSCAAACLEKNGDRSYAAKLFREAASIYERQATSVVGLSIREALWCLRQAYQCFLSGNDREQARKIFNKVISLEQRIAPFSMTDEGDVPHPQFFRPKLEGAVVVRSIPIDENIKSAVEDFLRAERAEFSRPQPNRLLERRNGGNREIETSSINQLG